MISIKIFVFNPFQVNTYILSDETNECIIIDPGCNESFEEEALVDYIENMSLKPVLMITTHCHIDHVLGTKFCKEKYDIDFAANVNDNFILNSVNESGILFGIEVKQQPLVDKLISEGEKIKFGNSELKVIDVPGHSPGSIVLYNENDGILITGDVLFKASIGRTDLPGGHLDTLLNGIKGKLLVLPGETVVYPGHGPSTSIVYETKNNPFL